MDETQNIDNNMAQQDGILNNENNINDKPIVNNTISEASSTQKQEQPSSLLVDKPLEHKTFIDRIILFFKRIKS